MIYLNKKPLLEDSFNSFVRSINIFHALEESYALPRDDRRDSPKEDKWLKELMQNHYTEIKDLKQTTKNLKDTLDGISTKSKYEKDMNDSKFEELKNVSYQPTKVIKQSRPFTTYAFPFNVLYLIKQVFVWVGNFLTRAFAKIAETIASLTGNKMQATVSLAKDAFIKEEEFMKGTYLPLAFNTTKEETSRIGQAEVMTFGSRISQDNRVTWGEDAALLMESYEKMKFNENDKFKVFNMQSSLTDLKKYLATFLQFYDASRGSFDENLLDVDDIEVLYTLFHDQLEAIQNIKSGGVDITKEKGKASLTDIADSIKRSYSRLEFRVDPQKTKLLLDTTLKNTDNLKRTYSAVEKKVVTILDDLLVFQNSLLRQTGTMYTAFSGETMSEMIILTSEYEDRINELKGQITNINNVKNKLNNLLKSFSRINGLYSGFNIGQTGNWQVDSNSDITKISNEIRTIVVMYIQITQLRYDNAYRYLDVLSSIKDLILSVSAINRNRNTYFN